MKRSIIKQVLKSMLIFVFGLSVHLSFAQDAKEDTGEKVEKFRKSKGQAEAKAEFEKFRSQIQEIKADPSLTAQEKKSKIKSIREEFRSEGGFKRKDRIKVKGEKSKFNKRKSENKDLRVEKRSEYKEEIQIIKNDPNLSNAEKKAKIEELKAQYNGIKRAQKGKLKKEIKSIKDDANLSKEEKKAKISELRSKYDEKRKKFGKTNRAQNQGILKAKKIQKAKVDPERAEKALKQLDKSESKLNKQYKKGKLTEAEFTAKLNKINNLRDQLSNN